VTVDVPLGTYALTYTAGTRWYGYRADKQYFGPETTCSKADEPFAFVRNGDVITDISVTLYSVLQGNLETHAIPLDEF